MSQNSHTLLLFFNNAEQIKACYQLFTKLDAGATEESQAIGESLGIDIAESWNNDWDNQSISHGPDFIRVIYDTATGYDMPLDVLQQMFAIGIKAACLEVFHSQVGAFSQFHFIDSRLIKREALYRKFPEIEAIIDTEFECDPDEIEQEGYSRPRSIRQLSRDKQQQSKDARELIADIQSLTRLSRETGENPLQLLKSALMLGAIGRGILHATIFGVVTILLFKGLWLWICLTVLLLIILPLAYSSDIDDESGVEEDENTEDDGEVGTEKC